MNYPTYSVTVKGTPYTVKILRNPFQPAARTLVQVESSSKSTILGPFVGTDDVILKASVSELIGTNQPVGLEEVSLHREIDEKTGDIFLVIAVGKDEFSLSFSKEAEESSRMTLSFLSDVMNALKGFYLGE